MKKPKTRLSLYDEVESNSLPGDRVAPEKPVILAGPCPGILHKVRYRRHNMDTETRKTLREFCKKRTQIHRRLKNAAMPSTNTKKLFESDKSLEGAARSLERNDIKLIAVAHILARAIKERQLHEMIIADHKDSAYRQREAERAYARLQKRLKNRIWGEINKLNISWGVNKEDILGHIKSEVRVEKLFQKTTLGKVFEERAKKEMASRIKSRWTKSFGDNSPDIYLNNFCLRMIELYEGKGISLNASYIKIIADLINAFSVSPKKQTYHTIHNRISRLTQ